MYTESDNARGLNGNDKKDIRIRGCWNSDHRSSSSRGESGRYPYEHTFDTKVGDTTGSGDSFRGAFLAQLQKNGYNAPTDVQNGRG